MAQVKNVFIRQKVLDRCLRSPKRYSLKDLMERCNAALEIAGEKPVTSKNTILDDLATIERTYPDAVINREKCGRYVFYEYEDKSYSIYKMPLDDDGMAKLAQTISILTKFEGMPNFEWIDDMIEHFKSSLNIPTTKDTIVSFEDNLYLKNRNHFSRLFSAIASQQALAITYRPFGKEAKVYQFHPYFIKQFNNRWFLFGCVDKHTNLTNFPFDRIERIEDASVPYIPNDKFDFNDLFEDVVGVSNLFDEPEIIRLKIEPQTYDYIQSKPILPSQKTITKDDGSIIIEIKTVINRELVHLLLSYGAGVTVLEPQFLSDAIYCEMEKSMKKYQSVHLDCTDSI